MSAENIKDGGHAFPPGIAVDHAGDTYYGPYGMSLRDWFAGQALIALLPVSQDRVIAAHAAYRHADAMLAAREAQS